METAEPTTGKRFGRRLERQTPSSPLQRCANGIASVSLRVPVAICTAVTIIYRQDRLEWRSVRWAQEVLKCWTNRPHTDLDFAYINDGLHPSRIEEYAAGLMSVTTEAAE